MSRFYWQNVVVLCLGISVAALGAFLTGAGAILRDGAAIGIGGLFAVKGSSRLQCKMSDVLLAGVALCLVVLSKTLPSKWITPLVFEMGTLALAPIYAFTGLTYTAISKNQRSHRGV